MFLFLKGLFKICGVLEAKLSVGCAEYCVKSPGLIDEVFDEGVATVAVVFVAVATKDGVAKAGVSISSHSYSSPFNRQRISRCALVSSCTALFVRQMRLVASLYLCT